MKHRTRWRALVVTATLLMAGQGTASGEDQDTKAKLAAGETVVATANHLLRWYGSLPPFFRRFLEPAAVNVAALRRPAMATLIDGAPERALARTLGRAGRINQPDSVLLLLETQIDTRGDFDYIQYSRTFDGQTFTESEATPRLLRTAEQTFVDPSIFGRRLVQLSKEQLPVHGIALDGRLAWSELPFRLLDPVERLENQVPPQAFGAVFVGFDLIIVPTSGDLDDLAEELIARESFVSPVLRGPTGDEILDELLDMLWTTGDKQILWVPVDFDEAPGSRFTRNPDTDATIAGSKEWIEQISRGQSTIDVTYFPGILRLAPGAFDAGNRNPASVLGETLRAPTAFDLANGATGRWLPESWDRIAIVVDDVLRDGSGMVRRGAFTNDARYMQFYGLTLPFFMQHELGHTYYFGHTFYLDPSTSDPLGPGTLSVMPWSFMGQGLGDNRSHPASVHKLGAFWIAASEWIDASAGGVFRIVSHDRGPAGFLRTLRIGTDDAREYWVDMRRLWPEVPALHNGVKIYFTEDEFPGRFIGDLTYVGPASAVNSFTSPYQAGDTMEDTPRGGRIRILAVGEDPFIAGAYFADVSVERF